jgi:hypothetical protein
MKKAQIKALYNMLDELISIIDQLRAATLEPAPVRVNPKVQVRGLNQRISFLN